MSSNSSLIKSLSEKSFSLIFSGKTRLLQNIPGPNPIFPIGNILDFASTDPHKKLYEYAQQYGDIMCFWLGNLPNILINDPKLIEQVLVTDKDNFYKNSPRQAAKPVMNGSVFLSNGKDWEFKRRNHPFSANNISTYFDGVLPLIQTCTREHLEKLQPSSSPKNVEMFDELTHLSFRIFGLTILGAEMGEDFFSYFMTLMNEMNSRGTQLFPVSLSFKFWYDRNKWFNFIENQINAQQKHRDGVDLIAFLTGTNKTELSIKQLRDELSTIFTAGTRNVAIAVAAVLYLCSRHPEAKQKLQLEIEEFGSQKNDFHVSDINQLNYLDKVVKEALRLYPAVPLFIREVLPGKSVVLGGHSLPEKTQIFISSWAFHRSPNHWENPDTFAPERFNTEPRLFHYFPFGAGPRACVGMYFTLVCTKMILLTMLSEYSINVDSACTFDTRYFAGTIMPRDGLLAEIQKKVAV